MKTLKIILIIVIILVLLPVLSWLLWQIKPNRSLSILVVNKTVLTLERKEHRVLFWLLNNEKFCKPNKRPYNLNKDYFGFHPLKPEKSRKYEVERIKLTDIDDLASQYDMAYYVDTYGVYFNQWFRRNESLDKGSLIEGGLNNNDYLLIKKMQYENKLVIAEYNFLDLPTERLVRSKVEDLLDLHWSGWMGRYVDELNPDKSKDLPEWVVGLYHGKNNGEWLFKGPGIVLVNEEAKKVIVLEAEKHLDIAVPEIQTTEYGSSKFDLPDHVFFPKWFDIVTTETGNAVAEYKIHINIEGKSLLDENNLPSRFPAIVEGSGPAPFYYFSGDFLEYQVRIITARLRGARTFDKLYYNNRPNSNSKFIWTYYIPLMSQILTEYQATL